MDGRIYLKFAGKVDLIRLKNLETISFLKKVMVFKWKERENDDKLNLRFIYLIPAAMFVRQIKSLHISANKNVLGVIKNIDQDEN